MASHALHFIRSTFTILANNRGRMTHPCIPTTKVCPVGTLREKKIYISHDSRPKRRMIKPFASKFLAYHFVYYCYSYVFYRGVLTANNNSKEQFFLYLVRNFKQL